MLDWRLFNLAGDLLGELGDRSGGQVTIPLCDRRLAQVSIPIDDPMAGVAMEPLSTVLRAYWWGRPIFAGAIHLPRAIESEGRVELNAMDPGFRLGRSFVNQRSDGGLFQFLAAMDQSEIMAYLIEHVQPAGGRRIDGGAWPVPIRMLNSDFATPAVLRDRFYESGKNVWEAIKELSEVQGGPDFELDPLDAQDSLFTEDFEAASIAAAGWTVDSGGGGWTLATDRVQSGAQSLKFTSGTAGDYYVHKDFSLPVGLYMVEARVSWTGIAGTGTPTINVDPVTAGVVQQDDSLLAGPADRAAGEWLPMRAFVKVATAGTVRVYLQLGYATGTATGTVWFDSLRIKPIALVALKTYARQGTDKSATVRFHAGFGHENCTVLWEPAGDTVINRQSVQGQSEEGAPPVVAQSDQGDSQRAIGVYGAYEGRPDISTLTALQENARGAVEAAAFPIDFFDIIPAVEGRGYTRDVNNKLVPVKDRSYGVPPQFGPGTDFDYWVGDTIACVAHIDQAARGTFTGRVTDAVISEVEETDDAVVAVTIGPTIPAAGVT